MDGRFLLACDLDRTLLPNGAQPESLGARARFATVAARSGLVLAYVSGRHRALVEAAVADYGLPAPDYVIGDVGTSLYQVVDGVWQDSAEWDAAIAADWGGRPAVELAAALTPLGGLRQQEAEKQGRHKLSYYAPMLTEPAPLLAAVRACLDRLGVRANLVWSIDEATGSGLLDVLPASAGKLQALQFLLASLGLEAHHALFAGDSGNDIEVLAGPLPAVLVANADEAVRRQAVERARAQGHADLLYLARGGWAGMNGNYSAGVLEGLAHFRPDLAGPA